MTCHICGRGGFDEEDKNKMQVRDHYHLTGKFRGAAHSKCNLKYQIPMFIPVVFHNLSGYNFHFLIKKLRPPNPFITYLGTIPIFYKKNLDHLALLLRLKKITYFSANGSLLIDI